MAVSAEFAAHARDLFGGVGPIGIRRMFGGAGVYLDDAMFAVLFEDGLIYMRGDAVVGPAYEAEGCEQWVYEGRNRPVAMPFWRLPDSAMDDPDEAQGWARRSLVPAQAAAAEKRAAAARKRARKRG